MTVAEQFAKLYRGYVQRYGRFTIEGREESGKFRGKAQTLDKPITAADYARHVKGDFSIGVIPLTDDNRIHFAAIDLDKYPTDEDEHKKWIRDIVMAVKDQNVIVTQSKSGGLHIWLFSEEGMPAADAIAYMKSLAAHIGHSGCEIFPKQASRSLATDVGNWINLPFFGDTRKGLLVHETATGYDFGEIELAEFVDIASECAAMNTVQAVRKAFIPESDQRAVGPSMKPLWFDGPPCLQRLIAGTMHRESDIRKKHEEGQISDGQLTRQLEMCQPQLSSMRNITWFNVGVYLVRRDPDKYKDQGNKTNPALERKLAELQDDWAWAGLDKEKDHPREKLDSKEMVVIAEQAKKDAWNYQCNQQPLKAFCDRRTCLKRTFGVGSKDNEMSYELDGFTLIDTQPPYFAFNINGKRVAMSGAILLNQYKLAEAVLNQAKVVWMHLPGSKFQEMLQEKVANASVVEGPPGIDEMVVIAEHLLTYLERNRVYRGSGNEGKFITPGKALWSEDQTEAWFKIGLFYDYIQTKRIKLNRQELSVLLESELGIVAKRKGTTLTVNGKEVHVKPFIANIPQLLEIVGNG